MAAAASLKSNWMLKVQSLKCREFEKQIFFSEKKRGVLYEATILPSVKKAKGICALFKSQKKKRLRLLSGAQNNIFAP